MMYVYSFNFIALKLHKLQQVYLNQAQGTNVMILNFFRLKNNVFDSKQC
jgi:hypothetical protein